MTGPFAHVLHIETIARLAKDVTLERGRTYAAEGRVRALARKGMRIVATVQGESFYAVALWISDAGFGYICSCPAGAEGAFCKHCVATAFVWVAQNPTEPNAPRELPLEPPAPRTPFARILHRNTIANLARGATLEKGQRYAAERRVRALARKGTQLVATVEGESFYAVSLWVGAEGLGYICGCPMGAEGHFCKHCVAVAFTWVEQNPVPG